MAKHAETIHLKIVSKRVKNWEAAVRRSEASNLIKNLYLKETPTRLFYCEYCKIFKNSFFSRTLSVAAFENYDLVKL